MSTQFYNNDLTDTAWTRVAPVLPVARRGLTPLEKKNSRAMMTGDHLIDRET
jgi:hypothetical protein